MNKISPGIIILTSLLGRGKGVGSMLLNKTGEHRKKKAKPLG